MATAVSSHVSALADASMAINPSSQRSRTVNESTLRMKVGANGAATAAVDPRKNWPSRAEAAKRLGVSHSTIRRWQSTGALTAADVEGTWRFDPSELDELKDAA